MLFGFDDKNAYENVKLVCAGDHVKFLFLIMYEWDK